MLERPLRVLIVDDDQLQLELMDRSLRLEGFQVATSSSVFGVSNIMRSFEPDVMLIDVHIPALPGDQLLNLVRRNAPETTRYVLYSSCDEWRLRSLAKDTNADGWISKSADASVVAKKLREVCGTASKTDPPPRGLKTDPPPRAKTDPPPRAKTDPPPRAKTDPPGIRMSRTDPPPRVSTTDPPPRNAPEAQPRTKTEPPPRPKTEPPPG